MKNLLTCFLLFTTLAASSQNLFYKTYGSWGTDVGEDFVATPDGGYLIAGWSDGLTINKSGLLLKVDSLGELQWGKIYVGILDVTLTKIKQTADTTVTTLLPEFTRP